MVILLSVVWCSAWIGVALWTFQLKKKYANYRSFRARVTHVQGRTPRNVATLKPLTSNIDEFQITFQDRIDYDVGQYVLCMWDGRDIRTAQVDTRRGVNLTFIMAISLAVVGALWPVFIVLCNQSAICTVQAALGEYQ